MLTRTFYIDIQHVHISTPKRIYVSGQYLRNGLTDSIQIWHVLVTGFQVLTYFKVALNSHVLKSYVNFTLFFNRVYKK